jgi:hypothetical protein
VNGFSQECLFVDHRFFLAVNMQAQHCLLDEIFGVLQRSSLSPQILQQAFKVRRTRWHKKGCWILSMTTGAILSHGDYLDRNVA